MTPQRNVRTITAAIVCAVAAGWAMNSLQAATGTITPSPFQLILDAAGNPVNAGCIWTYTAGTSTPVSTYTDVALSVANANPIIASAAGRFTAFLTPGSSYKFTYENTPCNAGTHGATLVTADNIAATPTSAGNVDTTGTAGEAISAGQCVYLSDGSAGKTAGSWYKCDSGNAYSSITNHVAMAPSAISSGSTGTIRLIGSVTGLSSLSVGVTYYIGAAGAITSTAPALRRVLGQADTATSLVLAGDPYVPILPWVNDFRLTLTSGTPVTTADVTAATTLYCSPSGGNRIDLPDSNGNPQRVTSAEFSIAVPATTSQMYDVFAYLNGSTATLELLAWTNDTTRATAIVRTNGRWMKSGDSTRLYLGSVRTTAASGQTEDSAAKRYLWNNYNRVPRRLELLVSGATTWTYTTATIRQANGSTANQVEAITGVADTWMDLTLQTVVYNSAGAINVQIGIGVDSTTTFATAGGSVVTISGAGLNLPIGTRYLAYPAVGRHVYSWNEWSTATGTVNWNSTASTANNASGGISGSYAG